MVGIKTLTGRESTWEEGNLHGPRKAKLQADRQANEKMSVHRFLSDLNERVLNPAWLQRLKKLV